jgi:hypothetical protein
MISIYLDWNVIVQMKNGTHPELKTILNSHRFFVPFSTAHIGDLLAGFKKDPNNREFIDQDLELLSSLTKNNCLSNDGKGIQVNYHVPKDLFDERLNEKEIFRNFSLDKLEELFVGNAEIESKGKELIEFLRKTPLDSAFADALSNPESAEQLNIMFPRLNENPTMEGFFKSFGEMLTKMNENDHYKNLREITQKGLGINRDKMFNSNDPYLLIEKIYKKIDLNLKNFSSTDKNGPVWFNEITSEYLKLDMHGYQEDVINTTKGRAETFRNTTEDMFHAGFASTCNFYITNDNRAYLKTKKIYEKLNLSTLVLKPNEFLVYYNTFLLDRPLKLEIEIPIAYLKSEIFNEEKSEYGFIRTFHLPHFIFDFFNKMIATYYHSGEVTLILLSRHFPTNKKYTYFFEIENLSLKLYELFGQDIDKFGPLKQSEFNQNEWSGRRWSYGDFIFRLMSINGHFQLYYLIKSEGENLEPGQSHYP